ncbi:MAG: Acg family FMN-binding oxidoreductase [Ruegeria sp.]
MKRRSFLKIAGGGVILAAGGATAFAATRTPNKALAPWEIAGKSQYADPRMNALSYAILAPNPHNRQPWLVTLEGDDSIILNFDVDKQLPHTDPMDRQLTIGLGCFLELMVMAANANGYSVEMELFPDGSSKSGLDTRAVARARFKEGASAVADPLWAYVPLRRSNKEPYDTTRPVEQADLQRILKSSTNGTIVGGSVDDDEVTYWRNLTEQALRIEIETPHAYKESVDLFRIGKAEVNANPDGIDFSGPLFESLNITGLFTRAAALDRSSTTYAQGIEAVLDNCRTAMGHVWITTDGNARKDQINAGRDWLRLNLATTKAGLGIQPLCQALQEYPEMDQFYRQVHGKLTPNGGTVQMLARIGYGPNVPVSPRWPIEEKLVNL